MIVMAAFESTEPRGALVPKSLSKSFRKSYFKHHQDPFAGPRTGRWQVRKEPNGAWSVNSRLPWRILVSAETPPDWRIDEGGNWQGESLWKYSIGYSPSLLLACEDRQVLDTLLNSLVQFRRSEEWEIVSRMTAKDHALAGRLRAICTLAVLYQDRGWEMPDSAGFMIRQDVDDALNQSTDYFRANNHGAMVAVSILHASRLFDGLEESVAESAYSYLKTIIDDVFDPDGVPGENSPSYHHFWLNLLGPVLELLETGEAGVRSDEALRALLERSRTALSHFVDHTGRFIPIGDSHSGKSPVPPARNTSSHNAIAGFYTLSRADTLLTFNCGHHKYAHKHCDDTSVTLSFRGVPILLDAGFFGHDYKDQRVVHTKSQSAHSGLFIEAFDDQHPGRFYKPGAERIRGKLLKGRSRQELCRGTVHFADGSRAERCVRLPDEGCLELIDTVVSDVAHQAVQRFLVSGAANLEVEESRIRGSLGAVQFAIDFSETERSGPVRVFNGQTQPVMRGWVAPKQRSLEPAHCVEIPILMNRIHRTQVFFSSTV